MPGVTSHANLQEVGPNPIMSVNKELERLERLSLRDAKARWRETRGFEPPPGLPPKLMRSALAYDLQVRQYGGLSPATKRNLDRLVRKLEANPDTSLAGDNSLSPGVRLTREWRGERHVVEVLNVGFAYKGEVYQSLSVIARAITGAHWSGPRFFGLKSSRKSRDS